jgi:hypothetical protein
MAVINEYQANQSRQSRVYHILNKTKGDNPMKKNTLKEISRTLDYDSSIATIKLLLVSSQENFKKNHLKGLITDSTGLSV